MQANGERKAAASTRRASASGDRKASGRPAAPLTGVPAGVQAAGATQPPLTATQPFNPGSRYLPTPQPPQPKSSSPVREYQRQVGEAAMGANTNGKPKPTAGGVVGTGKAAPAAKAAPQARPVKRQGGRTPSKAKAPMGACDA